jgi:hypothetical protein
LYIASVQKKKNRYKPFVSLGVVHVSDFEVDSIGEPAVQFDAAHAVQLTAIVHDRRPWKVFLLPLFRTVKRGISFAQAHAIVAQQNAADGAVYDFDFNRDFEIMVDMLCVLTSYL